MKSKKKGGEEGYVRVDILVCQAFWIKEKSHCPIHVTMQFKRLFGLFQQSPDENFICVNGAKIHSVQCAVWHSDVQCCRDPSTKYS